MEDQTTLRKVLLARARENRKNPTPGEEALWEELRSKRLRGLKWRRQHVLSPYIVDFYCHRARLVVEVDGSSHDRREHWDAHRDAQLNAAHGVLVLRITEREARHPTRELLDHIAQVAMERIEFLEGDRD